jgi:hypothetical protein
VEEDDPDTAGVVYPHEDSLWKRDSRRPKEIRTLMGGKIAEEFYLGRPVKRGFEHDFFLASGMARHLSKELLDLLEDRAPWFKCDPDSLFATAYADARDKLTTPSAWNAVEALAAALLKHQRLSSKQACRVVRETLRKSQGIPVPPARRKAKVVCISVGRRAPRASAPQCA